MTFVRSLLCSCLALLACVPAAAQTQTQRQTPQADRPYRGVFASGADEGGQSLTGNASVSGGYDDNILADATRRTQFRNGQQGTLGQFSGSLNYSLTGDRGSLEAGAGSSLRYYPSLEDKYFDTYNANVDGEWVVLKDKPHFSVNGSAGYQPYTFLSDLTPGVGVNPVVEAIVAPDPDFVPISSQYLVYDGGADFNVRVTRRTTISSSYGYHLADRTERRSSRHTGSLGTTYDLNKDLSLHVIYRYTEAHYPTRIVRTHSPDVGLDFHHALSITRRTSLTFGIGTEAYVIRERTNYRLVGNASLSHEIGRSWTTEGSYQRGTYFSDYLPEPVFGDSGHISVTGLITRRINFEASANATVGNSGFNVDQKFDSYRGTVTLSTALNRYMNVGVDYSYYRYKFAQGVELDAGVPQNTNRQSVRAHLSFWAPLLNKTRRR